jgi:hypothetical protein
MHGDAVAGEGSRAAAVGTRKRLRQHHDGLRGGPGGVGAGRVGGERESGGAAPVGRRVGWARDRQDRDSEPESGAISAEGRAGGGWGAHMRARTRTPRTHARTNTRTRTHASARAHGGG